MPKSIRQQISAMIISREEMRFLVFMSGVSAFGVPADTSFFAGQGPFFKSVGYTFHHGGNHIYGGGYGTEDNQNGN